jgi:hypothetical protein
VPEPASPKPRRFSPTGEDYPDGRTLSPSALTVPPRAAPGLVTIGTSVRGIYRLVPRGSSSRSGRTQPHHPRARSLGAGAARASRYLERRLQPSDGPPARPAGRGPGAGARRRLCPNQERIRKRCIMLSYVSLRVVSISLPCLKYICYALCPSAYLCLKYILPMLMRTVSCCVRARGAAWEFFLFLHDDSRKEHPTAWQLA